MQVELVCLRVDSFALYNLDVAGHALRRVYKADARALRPRRGSNPKLHSAVTSSIGNLTFIKRNGSARSSMLLESGRASLAGLNFVRTLRGGISFVAGLFGDMQKTVSKREGKWKEKKEFLAVEAGCSQDITCKWWSRASTFRALRGCP